MEEIFYEESSREINYFKSQKKYKILNLLGVISFIIAIFWAFINFLYFDPTNDNIILDIVFIIVPVILFFVLGVVFFYFKKFFAIEYDYSFISGNIKISKVTNGTKRRFLLEFNCYEIELIGYVGSDYYDRISVNQNLEKMVLIANDTPSENKDIYYVLANTGGSKKLIFIETTEQFIKLLIKYSNSRVWEENIK